MTELDDNRVAVYIDFDNIVISRYDQVHGRNQFQRDRSRASDASEIETRLAAATVDVGAVLDFASSFGTLVLTRAYADWSDAVNAGYRHQLVGRAVDLVQLFPAAAYGKNGADIRLAVDAVEDLFRLPDLTHVIIVAGDSDYIALAQRAKRLGRYVVGIGVAGSTSKSLAAACDEMVTYDALPGLDDPGTAPGSAPGAGSAGKGGASAAGHDSGAGVRKTSGSASTKTGAAGSGSGSSSSAGGAGTSSTSQRAASGDASGKGRRRRRDDDPAASGTSAVTPDDAAGDDGADDSNGHDEAEAAQRNATRLLVRALRIGHEKEDADWLHSSAIKTQMRRMDPSFHEKALGYRSFSDFIRSRDDVAELDESGTARRIRLLD